MTGDPYRDGGGYGYDAGPGDAPGSALDPVSRWVRLAGAATSVALLIGVVVWGYKLAVRDVSGVPVIRAIEGPARIAPEDPGGELASHVGLAVNQVAGTGYAAPGPEQVMLAPDPEGLAEEDMTMAAVGPLPDPGASADPDPADGAEPAPLPVPDAAGGSPAPAAVVPPPGPLPDAAAGPDEGSPEAADLAPETEAATDTAAAPIEVIPETVPGVKHSPRPLARPDDDLAAEAVAAAVAAAMSGESEGTGPAVAEVDPASLPEGTRLAQIGAFESPDLAREEWARVATRFGALMEGKRRVIQQAASGGRTFYRLRVEGFADVDEARRFCAALVAEQTNCIPTLVR
ncbi:MAG: SPOR domain-containing protein [Sphingomonadales bacterium]|nr:SPOR domain-containing protein [Sphingomonadales bacterium]